MKKVFFSLLVILMLFCFVSCASADTGNHSAETEEGKTPSIAEEKPSYPHGYNGRNELSFSYEDTYGKHGDNEDTMNLEVVAEYSCPAWEDYFPDYYSYVLILKNHNDHAEVVTIRPGKAFDINGELLDEYNSGTFFYIAAGETNCVVVDLVPGEIPDHYAANIIVQGSWWDDIPILRKTVETDGNDVYVTLENTGEETIQFVRCSILFFDSEANCIGKTSMLFEYLEPGEIRTECCSQDFEFSYVEVYPNQPFAE